MAPKYSSEQNFLWSGGKHWHSEWSLVSGIYQEALEVARKTADSDSLLSACLWMLFLWASTDARIRQEKLVWERILIHFPYGRGVWEVHIHSRDWFLSSRAQSFNQHHYFYPKRLMGWGVCYSNLAIRSTYHSSHSSLCQLRASLWLYSRRCSPTVFP